MEYRNGDRIIGRPHFRAEYQLGTIVNIKGDYGINVRFDGIDYDTPGTVSIVSVELIMPATKLAILLLGLDNEV